MCKRERKRERERERERERQVPVGVSKISVNNELLCDVCEGEMRGEGVLET